MRESCSAWARASSMSASGEVGVEEWDWVRLGRLGWKDEAEECWDWVRVGRLG